MKEDENKKPVTSEEIWELRDLALRALNEEDNYDTISDLMAGLDDVYNRMEKQHQDRQAKIVATINNILETWVDGSRNG